MATEKRLRWGDRARGPEAQRRRSRTNASRDTLVDSLASQGQQRQRQRDETATRRSSLKDMATCYQFLELMVLVASIFNVFAGPVDLSATTHRQLGVSGHVHMDRVFDAASGQADDVCVIDDVLYRPDDRVPSSADSCEWCVCRPPGFACEPIVCQKPVLGCREVQTPGKCCPSYTCDCEVRGRIYQHGQQVETSSQAPCHACYCHLGEVRCTAVRCHQRSDCEPREVPGRCCPSYDHCPSKASTISTSQQTFRPPPEFQLPQRQRPGTGQPISTTISIDNDTDSSFVTNVDNNNISTMQPQDIITTSKTEDIKNTDDLIINPDKLETTTHFEISEQNLITDQNTVENVTNNSAEIFFENSSEPEKTAIEEKLSSIFINLESTTLKDKNEQTEENYKLSTFLSIETTTNKIELVNENLYTTSTAPVEEGTFKIGSTSPASSTSFDALPSNESTPSISLESITDTILVNPAQHDNIDEETLSEKDFIQEAIEAVSINNASDILLKLVEENKEKITSQSSESSTESIYVSFDTTTTKEIPEQDIKQEEQSTQDNNKTNASDVTESDSTTTILYSRNPLDKQEDLDLVENITTTIEDHTDYTIPFETTTVKLNNQTEILISEAPTKEDIDNLATRINIEIPTETIRTEFSTEIIPDIVITTESEKYTTSDVYIESTNSPITTEKIVEIVELISDPKVEIVDLISDPKAEITELISDPKVTTVKEIVEEILEQEMNGTENPTEEDVVETTTKFSEVESTTISIPVHVDSEDKQTDSGKLDIFSEINISNESDESSEFIKKKILPEILEWKSNVTTEEEHNETKIPDSWLKDTNNVSINKNVSEHSTSSKELEKINLNKTSNELNKFNENIDTEIKIMFPILEWKKNLTLKENNENQTSSLDPSQVENINKSVVNNSNENLNQKINSSSSEEGKKHILLINKNDSDLSEAVLKILPLVKEWKENLTKHEENAESTENPESDKNISNEKLDEVAKKILPEVLEWKTSVSKNDGESDASSIAIPEGWLEDAGIQGGITSFRGDPQEPLKILQDVIKQSQQGGFSSASAAIPVKRADLINDQDLVILQEFFKKLYLHENRDN